MKVLDLFSGCGGFALGAKQAGFRVPLAIDLDRDLTFSHALNFRKSELLLADLSGLSVATIAAKFGGAVDGIIGGPPCQGFSAIGKRNGDDSRRTLLFHYFRIVAGLRPKFFVMENVVGLGYADTKPLLSSAMDLVAKHYHMLGPIVLDASEFGAATKRRRLFVIGIRADVGDAITVEELEALKSPGASVRDAIADLESREFVQVRQGYDYWRLGSEVQLSNYAKRMRSKSRMVTGNGQTRHSSDVVKRFSRVSPGTTEKVGRHFRLAWDGHCPTLRAGTGAANGAYQSVRPIHPQEDRVITVREAARLQGFPDSFRFHPTTWHSFRMIGNSVSPVQAKAVLGVISARFS